MTDYDPSRDAQDRLATASGRSHRLGRVVGVVGGAPTVRFGDDASGDVARVPRLNDYWPVAGDFVLVAVIEGGGLCVLGEIGSGYPGTRTPTGRMCRAVAQSIAPGGVKIGALATDFLTNGMTIDDVGGQEMISPTTGVYQLNACIHWAPVNGLVPWLQLQVRVNNVPQRYGTMFGVVGNVYAAPTVADLITLTAGDRVSLWADHGWGSAIDTRTLIDACYVSLSLVRATT